MSCATGAPLRVVRPAVQHITAQIDVADPDDVLNGDAVYFAYLARGAAVPALGTAAWLPAGWTTTRNRAEHLLDSVAVGPGDWRVLVHVEATPQDIVVEAETIRIV